MATYALPQLLDGPSLRRAACEHSRMDVLRRELSHAPYDDRAVLLIPLEHGTRNQAELSTNSAGTEICPCDVSFDRAMTMAIHYHGNEPARQAHSLLRM